MTRIARQLDRIGTFLLAFVLAVIVWVVAVQQENPLETRTIERVPVGVHDLADDVALMDSGGATPLVNVRVRAPRSVWGNLTSADVEAYLDLSQAKEGRWEIPISVEPLVPSIKILDIDPPAQIVRLESQVRKSVPVQVELPDEPPFGYVSATPIVSPTQVTVSGPRSLVDATVAARLTVRLGDARSDVDVTNFVTVRDSSGNAVSGVTVEPRSVSVRVPVEQQQGFSDKSVRVRWRGNPATNYQITGVSAEPAIITLVGDPDILAGIPPFVETTPLDIEGATADIEDRLPLILPESVSPYGVQGVKVHVGIAPIQGSMTISVRPVVQGLAPDLRIDSFSPESLDIILEGPLPRLHQLRNASLRAILDLTGLEAGIHQIAPQLVLPEGVSAQALLPETVQVSIQPFAASTPTSGFQRGRPPD